MTAEIMEFIGKTDKNGNTARLRVDVANRKFYRDFVSFYGESIKVEKSAISKMVETYKKKLKSKQCRLTQLWNISVSPFLHIK